MLLKGTSTVDADWLPPPSFGDLKWNFLVFPTFKMSDFSGTKKTANCLKHDKNECQTLYNRFLKGFMSPGSQRIFSNYCTVQIGHFIYVFYFENPGIKSQIKIQVTFGLHANHTFLTFEFRGRWWDVWTQGVASPELMLLGVCGCKCACVWSKLQYLQ